MPAFDFSVLALVCTRLTASFVKSVAAGKSFLQHCRAALQDILLVINETGKNPSLFTDLVAVMTLQTSMYNWAALQMQRLCICLHSLGFRSAQASLQRREEAHTFQADS